jgi:hypothetical protein
VIHIALPVTKKVIPQLLVDQIIEARPMTSVSTSSIFSANIRYFLPNTEILFRDRGVVVTDMKVLHTSIRPFMPPGYPEPNEHYRLWLEKNAGAQGIAWNWAICEHNVDLLEIKFASKENATLFELTWK